MEDLFTEINTTVDQLITNVQVLHSIAFDPKFGDETQSLQKTQESLLAKLLELDKELETLGLKTTPSDQMTLIEDKFAHFGKLNQALVTKTYDHYSSESSLPIPKTSSPKSEDVSDSLTSDSSSPPPRRA